jgi:hypothetical protein
VADDPRDRVRFGGACWADDDPRDRARFGGSASGRRRPPALRRKRVGADEPMTVRASAEACRGQHSMRRLRRSSPGGLACRRRRGPRFRAVHHSRISLRCLRGAVHRGRHRPYLRFRAVHRGRHRSCPRFRAVHRGWHRPYLRFRAVHRGRHRPCPRFRAVHRGRHRLCPRFRAVHRVRHRPRPRFRAVYRSRSNLKLALSAVHPPEVRLEVLPADRLAARSRRASGGEPLVRASA